MTKRRKEFFTEVQYENFVPLRIVQVELSQQLPDISAYDEKSGKWYRRAFCVVCIHCYPLGSVEVQLHDDVTYASEYAQGIWDAVRVRLNEHLQQDGLSLVSSLEDVSSSINAIMPRCVEERARFYVDAPFVSVVICTHDRTEALAGCIDSLLRLHYPKYEIIIVDNAPTTPATAELIQRNYRNVERIHYIREDCQGLSLARNCGIKAAKGEIIAFTDDDVVVDTYWLLELVICFSANNVACVTGLILPLELETLAQYTFEQYGGFSKGFVKKTFGASDVHTHLYKAGLLGAGASMAFKTSFLQSIGGFDPALGAGSATRSAEETAVFLQALVRNYVLVYTPVAMVFHLHRRDYSALCTQVYNYGVGFTAYLIKSIIENPVLLPGLLVRMLYKEKQGTRKGIPLPYDQTGPQAVRMYERRVSDSFRQLTQLGREGMLYGLLAYIVSRWRVRHTHKKSVSVRNLHADYIPVFVTELDLGQPLSALATSDKKTGRCYQRIRCLVRLHGQPLGFVEFQTDEKEIQASEVAHRTWSLLSEEIKRHLKEDGLAEVTTLDERGLTSSTIPQCMQERNRFLAYAPFVSIIVPTRDRLENIQVCLASLVSLRYPHYEIIIVDNAPSSTATADFIRRNYANMGQVRYLREDRIGVSWARNCGIEAARGEIIAFTDDDVVVDRDWLLSLVKAFSITSDITCVTGIVLPLELETPAQFWFEEYGGFKQDLSQHMFNMKEHRPKNLLYPYAGSFGAGANMAIKKSFLYEVNGFEPALGGNGPSRCSQDTAFFFQVIAHGHTLVYEPNALVYHRHRREYEALRKQIYSYGIGFTAFLTKSIFDNPYLLFDLLIKAPFGLLRLLDAQSQKNRKKTICYPQELTLIEYKGMLYGPFAYLLTRWRLRNTDKRLMPSIMTEQANTFIPARIIEIELGQCLPILSSLDEDRGHCYQRVLCLIRLHTHPLGFVELQMFAEVLKPQDYMQHVWDKLSTQINEHLVQDGLPIVTELDIDGLFSASIPYCMEARSQFLEDAPFVSVVVATRNRPELLAACVRSLLALEYSRYEIIVVDNAPSDNATADLMQELYGHLPRVRYVREDRAGTCWARNRGIHVAKGEFIAFVDDDVVVDRYWLVELVKAFSSVERVACVTSLVLPMELETSAQSWFEEYGGFSKGFSRRIFDMRLYHPKTPLHPYATGSFGTGAGVAFRAAFLRKVGGFDPALGPGSIAQGGEDLALFFQVIQSGYRLVYEPASLLYHLHRCDYTGLRKQMYGYGVGLIAYLTKILVNNPQLFLDLALKLPYGIFFAFSTRSAKNSKKSGSYPQELTLLERRGMLYGPLAYLRSRRVAAKVRREQTQTQQSNIDVREGVV